MVQSDIWNITRRPIKWDDVLITRINSKICISGSFLSIQGYKSFVFFLFLADMIFKGWPMRYTVRILKHNSWTIKWDDVLITRINSKICISGSFLSIQRSKSFIFFLFLAEIIFKGWPMRCTVWFLKRNS